MGNVLLCCVGKHSVLPRSLWRNKGNSVRTKARSRNHCYRGKAIA